MDRMRPKPSDVPLMLGAIAKDTGTPENHEDATGSDTKDYAARGFPKDNCEMEDSEIGNNGGPNPLQPSEDEGGVDTANTNAEQDCNEDHNVTLHCTGALQGYLYDIDGIHAIIIIKSQCPCKL